MLSQAMYNTRVIFGGEGSTCSVQLPHQAYNPCASEWSLVSEPPTKKMNATTLAALLYFVSGVLVSV